MKINGAQALISHPLPNAGTDQRSPLKTRQPYLAILSQLDPVLRNTNKANNQVTVDTHSSLRGKPLELWALGIPPEIWVPDRLLCI